MSRSWYVDTVEGAVDAYLVDMEAQGNDEAMTGVMTRVLAGYAGISRTLMSTMLQDYRLRQRRGGTRYVLGAHGYGRSAWWRIIALPEDDPALCADLRRQQTIDDVHDATRRLMKDLGCEIEPSLRNTDIDRRIRGVSTAVETQLTGLVGIVDAVLG